VFRLNADPQPRELVRSQTINDRPQTILSSVRTFRPNPYRAERQGQIVRNSDQLFDAAARLFEQAAYRFTAEVHIGLRLCQLDLLPPDNGLPDQRPALVAFDLRLLLTSKQIDEHKSEIVSRPLVILSRIAESDDQPVVRERVHDRLRVQTLFVFRYPPTYITRTGAR